MVVEAAEPGTQVKSVADLAAAEVVVRKQGFDLILLDMALPDVQGMSGLLLLRQLQPAAPIAIVSARDDAQLVRRSAECGARGFIPKSMPIELMVNAVKVFLAGCRFPLRSDPVFPSRSDPVGGMSRRAGFGSSG
jgi:DNA-binding NarL/FixJ family response regulator